MALPHENGVGLPACSSTGSTSASGCTRQADLAALKVTSDPFEVMTVRGSLADEGLAGALAVLQRALSRRRSLAKLA